MNLINNAVISTLRPVNEPVFTCASGRQEKSILPKRPGELSETAFDIPLTIDGKEIRTDNTDKVVMPHNHLHVLAAYHIIRQASRRCSRLLPLA